MFLKIQGGERYMRQVVENVHHNTMSDSDVANSLKKLLTMSPGDIVPRRPLVGPTADKGITWLAGKIASHHQLAQNF